MLMAVSEDPLTLTLLTHCTKTTDRQAQPCLSVGRDKTAELVSNIWVITLIEQQHL